MASLGSATVVNESLFQTRYAHILKVRDCFQFYSREDLSETIHLLYLSFRVQLETFLNTLQPPTLPIRTL